MDSNLIRLSAPFTLKHTVLKKSRNLHSPPSFPASRNSQRLISFKLGSSRNDAAFDEAAFEAERLSLDAKAREAMAEASNRETCSTSENEDDPKAWKWMIRKRIWDLMEALNIAQNPRPVHHRIPNFVGASTAAQKLGGLEEFRVAKCVKVNPDSPQKQVRFLTLSGGRKLLTPQPRLRTGFFSVVESHMLQTPSAMNEACTSVGFAVDPTTGARLGKGEGFAELEYGMLRYMGAIDDSTPVVTSVHDCQLVDDIPVEKLLIHDVPVDIICTPTQLIYTSTSIPKPQGIYWDKTETSLCPSEKLPPTARRRR
ncbi:hypothetical protein SLA2020_397630 [Shorea laevis]